MKKNAKPHISEVHRRHFGDGIPIYRVEVTGKSPVFYDNGILGKSDLVDLITAENFASHFRLMLGDKLQFRTIKSVAHDHNRNPIYEEIKLLNISNASTKVKSLPVKAVNQVRLHDRNVNKFKQLLNGYLDKEFDFGVILRYVKNLESNHKLNKAELIKGIDLCLRRYENPLMNKELCRLNNLKKYLMSNMNVLIRWLYFGREWIIQFT